MSNLSYDVWLNILSVSVNLITIVIDHWLHVFAVRQIDVLKVYHKFASCQWQILNPWLRYTKKGGCLVLTVLKW